LDARSHLPKAATYIGKHEYRKKQKNIMSQAEFESTIPELEGKKAFTFNICIYIYIYTHKINVRNSSEVSP
jgi:hypothetical protein